MNSIQDISKIQLKKMIMNTNIFFDNCDYTKNDILNILKECQFNDNDYYTPNRKIVIHHIISKILTKRIINNSEKQIIFNIIELLFNKIDKIIYITFIYIIDKIFLYNYIIPIKQSILDKLSKNNIIENYINLYIKPSNTNSSTISSSQKEQTYKTEQEPNQQQKEQNQEQNQEQKKPIQQQKTQTNFTKIPIGIKPKKNLKRITRAELLPFINPINRLNII